MHKPLPLTAIVCMDANRGIGKDGGIPWHFKADLHHFQQATAGGVLIMGSRTWYSLPDKGLPNRLCIVLSRSDEQPTPKGSSVPILVDNPLRALEIARFIQSTLKDKKIFVIGGESTYVAFQEHITEQIISRLHGNYKCDTIYPRLPGNWIPQEHLTRVWNGDKDSITFRHYLREDFVS